MNQPDAYEFQVLSCNIYNRSQFDVNTASWGSSTRHRKDTHIVLFGRGNESSMCVLVTGCPLSLRIEIPSSWKHNTAKLKDVLSGLLRCSFTVTTERKGKASGYWPSKMQGGKPRSFLFLKITFDSVTHFRKATFSLKQDWMKKKICSEMFRHVYTTQPVKASIHRNKDILNPIFFSPEQQFFIQKKASPSSWFRAQNTWTCDQRMSRCGHDIEVHFSDLDVIEKTDIAPFVTLSYDIETYSLSKNFPKSHNPEDMVISIGMTYSIRGKITCREVLGLYETAPSEKCTILSAETEKDLLNLFKERFSFHDVDIYYGYNNMGFDMRYLMDRAQLFHEFTELRNWIVKNNAREEQALRSVWRTSYHKMLCYRHLKKRTKNVPYTNKAMWSKILDVYDNMFSGRPRYIKDSLPEAPYKEELFGSYHPLFTDKQNNLKLKELRKSQGDCFLYGDSSCKQQSASMFPSLAAMQSSMDDMILKEISDLEEEAFKCFCNAYAYFSTGKTKFFGLSRLKHEVSRRFVKKIASNAMGANMYYLLKPSSGLITFDLWIFIKNDSKRISYKLNDVAQSILGETKVDLPYAQMFSEWERGTPESRRIICEYCIQDCNLLVDLVSYFNVIERTVEMSRVCKTLVDDIFLRGQQIKCWNQICHAAEEAGLVLNKLDYKKTCKYQGATVLKSKPGYYSTPVVTLDFKSLYPSIMIGYNISTDTICSTPETKEYVLSNNIPHRTIPVGNETFVYVKETVSTGIIPKILDNILKTRYDTKKKMKHETDPNRKKILDARQLALKISANSVYGFLGASTGFYSCWPLPASTTSTGRMLIEQSKNSVIERFGADIIYGDTDSIMVKFEDCEGTIEGVKKSFKLGQEAAAFLTDDVFGDYPSIVMEFEKSAMWYQIWNTKKRYISLKFETMYEVENGKGKIDMKGLEPVRRDNCNLVQNAFKVLIRTMINKEKSLSLEEIRTVQIREFETFIRRLVDDKIPLEDYVISKKINKMNYKNPNIPQLKVFHKITRRIESGECVKIPPKVGDRITYVITQGKGKVYDKAEDPDWVRSHPKIKIDRIYYLEQQLRNPIVKFCYYTIPDMADRMTKIRHEIERQQNMQSSIMNFFKRVRSN